jgi:hypothetical protein
MRTAQNDRFLSKRIKHVAVKKEREKMVEPHARVGKQFTFSRQRFGDKREWSFGQSEIDKS